MSPTCLLNGSPADPLSRSVIFLRIKLGKLRATRIIAEGPKHIVRVPLSIRVLYLYPTQANILHL